MYAGELWPSSRCAACGSVRTQWAACTRVDREGGRCEWIGHMHYDCIDCGYHGSIVPSAEELQWASEEARRRSTR